MRSLRSSSVLPQHTAMLLSPWLLVGSALILGLAITFWAVKNTRQERENMASNLLERAGALMWALEGGARAGMGMQRTAPYLQFMLQEIARQPDIVHMAVITPQGTIIAHSDPKRVGGLLYSPELMQGIVPSAGIRWRFLQTREKERIFEAFRLFAPLPGFQGYMGSGSRMHEEPGHMMGMMHGRGRNAMRPRFFPGPSETPPGFFPVPGTPLPDPETIEPGPFFPDRIPQTTLPPQDGNELVVIIGLNMASFESALKEGERNILFTALLVGLLGVGAFLSLFWAQSYRMSRRLLLDTRAFADEVIRSLPLGLIILDTSGAVVQVNAVAEKLLGCSNTDLQGMKPETWQGADWADMARRVREGEAVLEEEHNLLLSAVCSGKGGDDSGLVPVSISASRIDNEKGESLGMIYLLRDLREVKRLQAEVRRNERLSTLGNMAARVAHEIRNPLSSIKGFATYLGARNDTEADREAARTMIGEVDRLNRVVSELLDFARPSNLCIAPAELRLILERALRLAQMDADNKNVTLQLDPEVDPSLWVAVDAERITQALLNLLLNAIQATSAGGSVTLSVLPHERARDGYVALRVTDTGQGMTPEVLAQVFSPYFTTRTTGTGLGLSIVSKIIEDHHGEIKITSTPGQGATVTISLPLAEGALSEHSAAGAQDSNAGEQPRA